MRPFEVLLFSTRPALIRDAVSGGATGVVVDWERRGKVERQAGADTQVGADTEEDLARVRGATGARVLCRIDPVHSATGEQVEAAITGGADEILVPMVRTPRDVEVVLEGAAGRCRVGILVETRHSLDHLDALARLPLARVYVGLNDLAIERRTPNLFTALVDGTVERVRGSFDAPVGVGGLTLPDRGAPIPCRLLIGEMARLGTDFSFLRRSFIRDVDGNPVAPSVRAILDAVEQARGRGPADVAADRRALVAAVGAWDPSRVSVS